MVMRRTLSPRPPSGPRPTDLMAEKVNQRPSYIEGISAPPRFSNLTKSCFDVISPGDPAGLVQQTGPLQPAAHKRV